MADYLEITEIRDRTSQGVTQPFKCLAASGDEYFVKGKSLGVRDSIKEWLGGYLAKSFGLPVPNFCAVSIDIELLKLTGDEALNDLGEGPAFASQKVPLANELRHHLIQHIPLQLQKDVVVFDVWIFNEDRTLTHLGGNPNLLWASNKLHVIDHNNGFDETFDPVSFQQSHVFCNRISEILGDMVERQRYQEKMQSALESCWQEAWNKMPSEWKEQNQDENWIDPDQLFNQLINDAKSNIWERL